MKILILGAGNLLLSDEGFGVHFIRYLENNYQFPDNVELCDAGTSGIMITHKLEEAELVYIVDVIKAKGEPGTLLRYDKKDIMLKQIPLKMSPHQIGIQEMLLVSEMRGHCPDKVFLLGVIPASTVPGNELSPVLEETLIKLAEKLVSELRDLTKSSIIKKP
ncbi:MAG: HyaD/HybD family hydrogenase maturation endopeptidase [Kiritimatiellae bacterium]|nr:HyaD/HybD family hydrogenase maturation endopeptidase [Kiritimatiellia bacterium]MDD5521149.1 HyaD/HybD family hydrogenase maturation endopeptidase [Kiritimatiellia bacterium]